MAVNYKKALGFIPDLASRVALFEWLGEFGESPLQEAEKSWPLAKYESGLTGHPVKPGKAFIVSVVTITGHFSS